MKNHYHLIRVSIKETGTTLDITFPGDYTDEQISKALTEKLKPKWTWTEWKSIKNDIFVETS